ncbi:MAG: NADH-quinone oxidoreductase subunit G, partial [Betaproteobacteria bacterium]|nr:NADH-quinone oxidoreductase subunit G [Betaproteobacteria bacterium]
LGAGAEFVGDKLNNAISGVSLALAAGSAGGLQRIADVPIHFADPLARRAPALRLTRDGQAPVARASAATLAQLGLESGIQVRVTQGAGNATLSLVADEGVPAGCVRVAAAHAATAALGEAFGQITVERA